VIVWPNIMGEPSVRKTETMIPREGTVPPCTKVRGGIIAVTTLI
jgi:hypothetical protein